MQVERNRVIHSYLNRNFGVADLDAALDMLAEVMHFMFIIDTFWDCGVAVNRQGMQEL